MLFKPYHVPLIRAGEKTVTRRRWDRDNENHHPPRVGSIQPVRTDIHQPRVETDCFIRLVDRYWEPLGQMTDRDAQAEGDYATVEEFRQGWERIWGEGSWDPDEVVAVNRFEYAGRTDPTSFWRL